MRGNFDNALKEILRVEGSLGVSKEQYEAWVGYRVSDAIMRRLNRPMVSTYYKCNFWEVTCCDRLPAGLDVCVMDLAICLDPKLASNAIQRVVGAHEDGIVGAKTLSLLEQLISAKKVRYVIQRYQDERRYLYSSLTDYSKSKAQWVARCDEIELIAMSMVNNSLKYA